jgi:hypothetical protein
MKNEIMMMNSFLFSVEMFLFHFTDKIVSTGLTTLDRGASRRERQLRTKSQEEVGYPESKGDE